jgi:hypothetical protein
MNNRERVLAMLPWYCLGAILIGLGSLIGVVCQATLNLGLFPLWTVFVLAAMLCLIKGFAVFTVESPTIG